MQLQILNEYNIVLGAVEKLIDGSIRIKLNNINDDAQNRIVFYHELAHSILHIHSVDPKHEDSLIEAEAWLFSISCAIQDGRSSVKEIQDFLSDFSQKIPAKYARAYTVVLRFFTDNWTNLVEEESSIHSYATSVIITLDRALIERIAKTPQLLYDIKPHRFEDLMSKLFDGLGYIVEQTRRTRDGGVDIVAIKSIDRVNLRFLIECKRWDQERRVGVSLVRSLFGVKQHLGASKAIIATTSSFTRPAMDFAQAHRWDLELKDFDGILQWVELYLRRKEA